MASGPGGSGLSGEPPVGGAYSKPAGGPTGSSPTGSPSPSSTSGAGGSEVSGEPPAGDDSQTGDSGDASTGGGEVTAEVTRRDTDFDDDDESYPGDIEARWATFDEDEISKRDEGADEGDDEEFEDGDEE